MGFRLHTNWLKSPVSAEQIWAAEGALSLHPLTGAFISLEYLREF